MNNDELRHELGNDQVAMRLQAFSAHVRVELGVGLDHVLKD